MSTNFYWNPAANSPLACFGQLHIGKRSGGWAFTFQAYEFEGSPASERAIDVGGGLYVKVSLPELPSLTIKSFEDWKLLLAQSGSTLQDEYGSTVTAEEFLKEVETDLHPLKGKWDPEGQNRPLWSHYDELVKNVSRYGPVDPARDWKDSEGFSFSLGEFS